MKLLFFIRALTVGGSQRQLALLATGLSRRGHDVAVAVLYGGGALESMLGGSAVRLLPIDKAGRWQIVRPAMRLARLFAAERPDVIYAFLPTQTTLSALLLPPRRSTRLVFALRGQQVELRRYDWLHRVVHVSEAWLSRRADLTIANAQSVRADAIRRGFPLDRIAVVPNGIDTESLRPDAEAGRRWRRRWGVGETDFVVGMVARLDPMKDHRSFLEAAALFAREHRDARFVCVGDGPAGYRAAFVAQAQSLGLKDRLTFTGEVAPVTEAINAFDIATSSSAFGEGFSNAIAEAMACGIPVVATEVGDARSIIGDCGELVPPCEPGRLSAAWANLRRRLAEDTFLRQRARDRIVTRFGVEAMIEASERILAALSEGRPAAIVAGEPA